jgi:hypothetical protein
MDFATLTTQLVTVVQGAITAAVPLIAVVLGATIGYKLYKRFTKG